MRSQTQLSVKIVRVRWLSAYMVFWDVKRIEAVLWRDSWIKVIEKLELLSWHANVRKFMCLSIKEIKSLVDQCGQRVLRLLVKLSLGEVYNA